MNNLEPVTNKKHLEPFYGIANTKMPIYGNRKEDSALTKLVLELLNNVPAGSITEDTIVWFHGERMTVKELHEKVKYLYE